MTLFFIYSIHFFAKIEITLKLLMTTTITYPENYYIEKIVGSVKVKEHKLNNSWVLWRHPVDSKDWTLKGYQQIAVMSTVEEFWLIYNSLPSVAHDMWFLMREGIPPIWEDAINQEGGAFKFRVHRNDADNKWLTLSMYLVAEQMCRIPSDAELISGISLSPKKGGYTTISVWNLDKTRIGQAIFPTNISGIDFTSSLYEAHSDRKCG